jgi:hypothetical protein
VASHPNQWYVASREYERVKSGGASESSVAPALTAGMKEEELEENELVTSALT